MPAGKFLEDRCLEQAYSFGSGMAGDGLRLVDRRADVENAVAEGWFELGGWMARSIIGARRAVGLP
jgi:hypothetical protein